MPSVPEPRTHTEHAPPCHRHHTWMANCPLCRAWHRDHLKAERDEAARRQQQREAAP